MTPTEIFFPAEARRCVSGGEERRRPVPALGIPPSRNPDAESLLGGGTE